MNSNGTFVVKSETRNVSFEYQNNAIIVKGVYVKPLPNGDLKEINGQVYYVDNEGEVGSYIGSFSGYLRNNEIKYTMTDMNLEEGQLVLFAIEEIMSNVTNEQQ